jgi:hypothetical protein
LAARINIGRHHGGATGGSAAVHIVESAFRKKFKQLGRNMRQCFSKSMITPKVLAVVSAVAASAITLLGDDFQGATHDTPHDEDTIA